MTTLSENRRASGLSPEFPLLGLLEIAPAHGYELHQKLNEQLGEIWRASRSQTYNILARLEEHGYIRGTTEEQASRPSRRRFDLTTSGRERLEAWLVTPTAPSTHAIRLDFMSRLYFLYQRNPQTAQAAASEQAKVIEAHLKELTQRQTALDPQMQFNRLGAEMRIRQLTSLLDWLRELSDEIGAGA